MNERSDIRPDDHVRLERGDNVVTLILSRPEKANALCATMIDELLEELTVVEQDDSVKAIVIAGEGRHLTAGLDASEVGAWHYRVSGSEPDIIPSLRDRLRVEETLLWGREGLYSRVLHCKKVTVLAAHGACLDSGLFLALCSDIVVAANNAYFGNPRWRHVGVHDDVSLLISAVGRKRAAELMYCGLSWNAEQALGAGLVDLVVAPDVLAVTAAKMARAASGIMRDGIAAEKYLMDVSLAKMGVETGFATAIVMGAMASNIQFRPGEFNYLKARRDLGTSMALQAQAEYFGRPGDDLSKAPEAL